MKIPKTLFLTITILIITSVFFSCSDKDDPHGRVSNFEVPELTQENSIQFTVDTRATIPLWLQVHGKKVAVDWGDGSEIEKDDLTRNRSEADYDSREIFSHKYGSSGVYTIKVWSAEVIQFALSTDLINKSYSFDNLTIGYSPVLETLLLENLESTALSFNSNLPKLTLLSLQMMKNIKSLDVAALSNLEKLHITNLAKLEQLDVSSNGKLWELSCSNVPVMNSVGFENNVELARLKLWDCDKLTNIDLSGIPKLATFEINRVPLTSLDLSKQVELGYFTCSKTNLTAIDVSKNVKLYYLSIANNGLTALNVTKNLGLAYLDCGSNQLTALDVSENKNLEALFLINNQFTATALNDIFTALPVSKYRLSRLDAPPRQTSIIAAYDNPGYKDCNVKIITDKGWLWQEKK